MGHNSRHGARRRILITFTCRCGHVSDRDELVPHFGPDPDVEQLARRGRCLKCRARGQCTVEIRHLPPKWQESLSRQHTMIRSPWADAGASGG
jgi:hypothetical protein